MARNTVFMWHLMSKNFRSIGFLKHSYSVDDRGQVCRSNLTSNFHTNTVVRVPFAPL